MDLEDPDLIPRHPQNAPFQRLPIRISLTPCLHGRGNHNETPTPIHKIHTSLGKFHTLPHILSRPIPINRRPCRINSLTRHTPHTNVTIHARHIELAKPQIPSPARPPHPFPNIVGLALPHPVAPPIPIPPHLTLAQTPRPQPRRFTCFILVQPLHCPPSSTDLSIRASKTFTLRPGGSQISCLWRRDQPRLGRDVNPRGG